MVHFSPITSRVRPIEQFSELCCRQSIALRAYHQGCHSEPSLLRCPKFSYRTQIRRPRPAPQQEDAGMDSALDRTTDGGRAPVVERAVTALAGRQPRAAG